MDEDFKINDIVPYEFTYIEQQGFSVITIIGLIFISVLFSKLFPRLIGEVIIPFFIHSESKLYNQIGFPIISEISLLFIPCFSLKFYDSQLSPDDMNMICPIVPQRLPNLDLSNLGLNGKAIVILAKRISCSRLQSLDLSYNPIGDESAWSLLEAIAKKQIFD